MKFRKKTVTVQATQWYKNGDHPKDDCFRPFEDTGLIPTEKREGDIVRYYRLPELDGQGECEKCGRIMHDHGWIDIFENGHTVCPSDWIITGIEGEFYPIEDSVFHETYEKV